MSTEFSPTGNAFWHSLAELDALVAPQGELVPGQPQTWHLDGQTLCVEQVDGSGRADHTYKVAEADVAWRMYPQTQTVVRQGAESPTLHGSCDGGCRGASYQHIGPEEVAAHKPLQDTLRAYREHGTPGEPSKSTWQRLRRAASFLLAS